jgi:hypothetical protein
VNCLPQDRQCEWLADNKINPFGLFTRAGHQVAKAGEQNYLLLGIGFLDLAREFVAIHFRHRAVGKNEVKATLPERVQSLPTILGHDNFMLILGEINLKYFTDERFVLYDEDGT